MQTNILEFVERFEKGHKLTDALLDLGYGYHDASIKDQDLSEQSDADEEFLDLLVDTFEPHTMKVGEVRAKGSGEVSCRCIHEVSQLVKGEQELVKFYIVNFQCEPVLLAIGGTLNGEDFIPWAFQIVSTAGPNNVEGTGYIDEMMGDLRDADDNFFGD